MLQEKRDGTKFRALLETLKTAVDIYMGILPEPFTGSGDDDDDFGGEQARQRPVCTGDILYNLCATCSRMSPGLLPTPVHSAVGAYSARFSCSAYLAHNMVRYRAPEPFAEPP